jgi:hypothetical protein
LPWTRRSPIEKHLLVAGISKHGLNASTTLIRRRTMRHYPPSRRHTKPNTERNKERHVLTLKRPFFVDVSTGS